MDGSQQYNHQLNWSMDTTVSRKTSLLEDEREPHELMLDSDVTQQSMDSLDGFNSEAELIKLERCRTMPVSALYDAMRHAEERNQRKLASGRSLSMSSLGSLWDQDYKQRATDYTREIEEHDEDDKETDSEGNGSLEARRGQRSPTPPQHSFRLHTPIPEEDCCSSGSNESITYVFMNPQPSPLSGQGAGSNSFTFPSSTSGSLNHSLISGHTPSTNPSSILQHHQQPPANSRRTINNSSNDQDDFSKKTSCAPPRSLPRNIGQLSHQQPRTLSMDSIDVEHCMNFINQAEPPSPIHDDRHQNQLASYIGYHNGYHVETPHTTLERNRATAERRLRRENSGIHIESTDQEYPGIEPTPYQVDSATTDPETTGPEHSPRLWSLMHHQSRRQPYLKHSHDSGSDYDGNDLPGSYRMAALQRPPSQTMRRSSAKVRRKPSRTRAIETQTDDDLTGYSSQPASPGVKRKIFSGDSYALMRSITSGGPLNEAAQQLATTGQLEPTVHLLTEVVSLMKMMMSNLPTVARCRNCQQCQCSGSALCQDPVAIDNGPNSLKPVERPNFLNLSSLSDSASSDPEPTTPATTGCTTTPLTAFREGFLIERFRQSRQDRIATAGSQSDIASCVEASDAELDLHAPDSLSCPREGAQLSGASTPTDEFRTFPTLSNPTTRKSEDGATPGTLGEKISPADTADSGISDRWESQGSSCGSTGSHHRNHTAISSESMSTGQSSLSSTDNTPDSSLGHAPETTDRTSGPVLTQWAHLTDMPVRTSTPVRHLTTWMEQAKEGDRVFYDDYDCQDSTQTNVANSSTETSVSYKTTQSHISRYEDSADEFDSFSAPVRKVTRPSKLAMMKEREQLAERLRNEERNKLRRQTSSEDAEQPEAHRNKKPLDELKRKWQTPCDLIPCDSFLPLPTQTRLRCSPNVPPQGL